MSQFPIQLALPARVHHLAAGSVSPPFLPVWLFWLTVSLIPWLSEFHAVWFSGTSGFLLILDWLLSSFWSCEEAEGFYLPSWLEPPQIFIARVFEALFPHAGTLDCVICLTPELFLPAYLHASVGPRAVLWPTPVCQLPLCFGSLLPQLPVSAHPISLDECFFNSLVVWLPCSLIFWQLWLFFVFKLLVFLWLCEEAKHIYLCLHLGYNYLGDFFHPSFCCWFLV